MVREEVKQRYRKTIEKFCLMDDIYMSVFYADSISLTEKLLRLLLENDKIKVIKCSAQYAIKNLQGHSSVLDVFCQDGYGRFFNVEVQRENSGAIPQRARYYTGLIDGKHFQAGNDYHELKDTYVIFITEHDILGFDLPIYHIERVIKENGADFNDGAHIIYVNGEKREAKTALGRLMHDFFCQNPDDMFDKELAERARYLKEEQGGLSEMCELMQKLTDEAVKENKIETAEKSLAQGATIGFTVNITGLSKDEVEAIAARMNQKFKS